MSKVRCPICQRDMVLGRLADWPSFPFCGPKCRLIDLGRWLGGGYGLPADEEALEGEAALELGELSDE